MKRLVSKNAKDTKFSEGRIVQFIFNLCDLTGCISAVRMVFSRDIRLGILSASYILRLETNFFADHERQCGRIDGILWVLL